MSYTNNMKELIKVPSKGRGYHLVYFKGGKKTFSNEEMAIKARLVWITITPEPMIHYKHRFVLFHKYTLNKGTSYPTLEAAKKALRDWLMEYKCRKYESTNWPLSYS